VLALHETTEQSIADMVRRCSPGTLRQRLHGNVRQADASLLSALGMYRADHLSLIAVAAGQPVGLATVVVEAPHTIEAAVLVEDAWQRHGIGSALAAAVCRVAAAEGYTRALVDVELTNMAAVRLAISSSSKLGLGLTCTSTGGSTRQFRFTRRQGGAETASVSGHFA